METSDLSRYSRQKQLHESPLGAVWLCEDTRSGKQVVVKSGTGHQLDVEVQLMSWLWRGEHRRKAPPSILHPLGFVLSDEEHKDSALVFDVLEEFPQGKANSLDELKSRMTDLLTALEWLHSEKVVHGDMCPMNTMSRPGQGLVLIDFGMSTTSRSEVVTKGSHTDCTVPIRGHIDYLPPEMLDHSYTGFPTSDPDAPFSWIDDPAIDMWGAGMCLAEWLTGVVRPFSNDASQLCFDNVDARLEAITQSQAWVLDGGCVQAAHRAWGSSRDMSGWVDLLKGLLSRNTRRRLSAARALQLVQKI